MRKRPSGEIFPTEVQPGPSTEVGSASPPADEIPCHFPGEEALTSGTPKRRTEVETATASMSAHSAPAVKLERYMAPEQARSAGSLAPAADIFALGCVLFEALAGKPAFEGPNAKAILAKLIFGEAPLLEAHCPDAPLAAPTPVSDVARYAVMLTEPHGTGEHGGNTASGSCHMRSASFSRPA